MIQRDHTPQAASVERQPSEYPTAISLQCGLLGPLVPSEHHKEQDRQGWGGRGHVLRMLSDCDWSPSAPSCSLKRRQFPLAPPSPDKHNGHLPMPVSMLEEGMWRFMRLTVHREKVMMKTVRFQLLLRARWVVLGQGTKTSPQLDHEAYQRP